VDAIYHVRNKYCLDASTDYDIMIGIINVLVSSLCIIIASILFYKILLHHKTKPFPCFIQMNQISFFTVSILLGISSLFSAIFLCALIISIDMIILGLLCILRVIQISEYQLIFGLRVINVFHSTTYEIGKCNIILAGFLWSIYLCVTFIAAGYFMIISPHPQYLPVIAAFLLLFDLAINTTLSLVFICKLSDLHKTHIYGVSSLSREININDDNALIRNNKILHLITKYTVLSIISTVSSLIWISLNACYAFPSCHGVYFEIALVGPILNAVVLIDIITMSLSFQFTGKYYIRCCGRCDSQCRKCCVRCTVRKKRRRQSDVSRNNGYI